MRIERVRIEGFGALSGVDLAWPEGKLLLAVDSNEAGKTTFCEAIVAGLYGISKGRGAAGRPRDLRRPRSGAPFAVALDVEAEGRRWSVERDLAAGTVRIVDRGSGTDCTGDFLRSGGRDVFGEKMTGLTEPLFRSTAYVGQNVLDHDELDSSLTVELARIADSGGGDASVLRAMKSLEGARIRMPEPQMGPTVSVDTEVARAERQVAELEVEVAKRRRALEGAAAASMRRSAAAEALARAQRQASLGEASVDETDRVLLVRQLQDLEERERVRKELHDEAERLEAEAGGLSPDLLGRIDRLREERGQRPEALELAERRLEGERRAAAEEEEGRARRFGAAAFLPAEESLRLGQALRAVIDSEAETATAEEEFSAQWEELAREGLAEDIRKLDLLPVDEREFLRGAEESRQAMEMAIVLCDRRRADVRHQGTIVLAERKVRVAGGHKLLAAAAVSALLTLVVAAFGHGVGSHWIAAGIAFSAGLALVGAVLWERGRRHRESDRATAATEEEQCQREAERIRKGLSDLRLHLDRVSRLAAFQDPLALVKAYRRARLAEEKRHELIARGARRDAAVERRRLLEAEVEPFRAVLGSSAGLPSSVDARKTLGLLGDVDKAVRAAAARKEAVARDAERLAAEQSSLTLLEGALREALSLAGVPARLPLAEAFLVVEGARRRAARRREIVEVELPARTPSLSGEEVAELRPRIDFLDAAVAQVTVQLGASRAEVKVFPTPEGARSAAAVAREKCREAETELATTERELATFAREGAERAREAAESLAQTRAVLERARLFRDAVDLAREALSLAVSRAYGDFRQGLHEASRRILGSWDLQYEALEFSDDLAVSVRTRDGRTLTRAELAGGLSTGAREQLHLTARLAAVDYLGLGERGVPILLDDPLVGADDERFGAIMRFLVEKVLPDRQILVVSCHAWRHEKLLLSLGPELRGRLEPVSLSVATGEDRR